MNPTVTDEHELLCKIERHDASLMQEMHNDLENCLREGKDPVLLLVVWRDMFKPILEEAPVENLLSVIHRMMADLTERVRADQLREIFAIFKEGKVEFSHDHGEPDPSPPIPIRYVLPMAEWNKLCNWFLAAKIALGTARRAT